MKKRIIIAVIIIAVVATVVTVLIVKKNKKEAELETQTTATWATNGAEQFETAVNTEKKSNGELIGIWVGETDTECYYSFNSDSTGSYTLGTDIKTFTYTDNGDTVTIVFDGNSKEHVYKYEIDGNSLLIEDDYGTMLKFVWKV